MPWSACSRPTRRAELGARPRRAWRVHVADSLSGLEFAELARARRIADVGAGAGFPGLVLAAALPAARVDLIESVGRKCEFMRARDRRGRARQRARGLRRAPRLGRAAAARRRPRGLRRGHRARGRAAVDAGRARLAACCATAASLVAWKGRRDAGRGGRAATRGRAQLAMRSAEVRGVGPYAGSRNRHLHLVRKAGPTPDGLPAAPGDGEEAPVRFGGAPVGRASRWSVRERTPRAVAARGLEAVAWSRSSDPFGGSGARRPAAVRRRPRRRRRSGSARARSRCTVTTPVRQAATLRLDLALELVLAL